jgi:hypothetical protein
MQAAHAHCTAARRDDEPIADRDPPRGGGAGDDGADAGQREAAVHREAKVAALARRSRFGARLGEVLRKRLHALAGDAGHRQHVGAGERGGREQRAHLGCGLRKALAGYQIGLGQRDDAAREAEQVEDGQVLARLRHRPVVGGNHEQHMVDAGRAGEHLRISLWPGVDEAEHAAVGSGW